VIHLAAGCVGRSVATINLSVAPDRPLHRLIMSSVLVDTATSQPQPLWLPLLRPHLAPIPRSTMVRRLRRQQPASQLSLTMSDLECSDPPFSGFWPIKTKRRAIRLIERHPKVIKSPSNHSDHSKVCRCSCQWTSSPLLDLLLVPWLSVLVECIRALGRACITTVVPTAVLVIATVWKVFELQNTRSRCWTMGITTNMNTKEP